jgi:hypothetical protein
MTNPNNPAVTIFGNNLTSLIFKRLVFPPPENNDHHTGSSPCSDALFSPGSEEWLGIRSGSRTRKSREADRES